MDSSEHEGKFDVFVYPSFAGQNPNLFEFANWCPDEEISRQFNRSDINELLDKINKDDLCYEVSTSSHQEI